ncbi:MAG: hypothetical protein ACYSUB_08825 [Planctomycetota bacterium]|jgi:hypothetical protein
MDTKQIAEAVLKRRGSALLFAGIVLLVLCATKKAAKLEFDPPGRVLLGMTGSFLVIFGTRFIVRDWPSRSDGKGSSDCPVTSRDKLPKMDQWLPAQRARDILIIGQNLNLVLRQKPFFKTKLDEETQIRLVIVNPKDDFLIEVMRKGVVEHYHTKPDFKASLETIQELRQELPDDKKSLIDLRIINYVPTLSFQVLDGDKPWGTILVELAPNRITVPQRPHFLLLADNRAHSEWYRRFLDNCEKMYTDATPWEGG